jgi:AraC-like DNA-binding protein
MKAASYGQVVHVGYADHTHLIRSLKRFCGKTPTQIMACDLSRIRGRMANHA